MEKAQEAQEKPPAYNEGYGQGPPPSYPGHHPQQQQQNYPTQPQPYPQQGYTQVPTQEPATTNQPVPNVVYVQPPQPLANPPNDYLCFNIFVTICCCWPIGIFAILKSVETREATNRGDRERADSSSRQARKWGYVTLAIGVILSLVSAIIVGVYIYFIVSGGLSDID